MGKVIRTKRWKGWRRRKERKRSNEKEKDMDLWRFLRRKNDIHYPEDNDGSIILALKECLVYGLEATEHPYF